MTLAHNLLSNMVNGAFVRGACMKETRGLQRPELGSILEQSAAKIAEEEAVMFYDNLYALGHIFQIFLQDTPERLDHGEDVLASDDASYAGADVTLGSRLLAWLDRQNIVLDVGHKATLLQIASTHEALTSTCDDFQPLTIS